MCIERKKNVEKIKKKCEKKRFRMRVVYVYICQFCDADLEVQIFRNVCVNLCVQCFFFLHSLALSLIPVVAISKSDHIFILLCASFDWFLCQTFIAGVFILSFSLLKQTNQHKPKNVYVYKSNISKSSSSFSFIMFPKFSLVSFCHRRCVWFFFLVRSFIRLSNEE